MLLRWLCELILGCLFSTLIVEERFVVLFELVIGGGRQRGGACCVGIR